MMAYPIKELIYYYTDADGYCINENDQEDSWTVEKWLQFGTWAAFGRTFYSIVCITYNDNSTYYIERSHNHCSKIEALDNKHLMFMLKCS